MVHTKPAMSGLGQMSTVGGGSEVNRLGPTVRFPSQATWQSAGDERRRDQPRREHFVWSDGDIVSHDGLASPRWPSAGGAVAANTTTSRSRRGVLGAGQTNVAVRDDVDRADVCALQATRYVVSRRIDGALVECGVWRGGSSLLMALTLLQLDDLARNLYVFDTFDGMPPPSEVDVTYTGERAADLLARSRADGRSSRHMGMGDA